MRILRWPGNLLHFVFVFIVVLVCLLLYLLGRIATLFIFNRARRSRAVGKLRGKLLRLGMTALGATFIKMGQVLSTRPDLLSAEVIAELRVLQDRLPAFGFWRVRRRVERDLGPLEQHFSEFDKQPVAAASVAQVHRARLKDGREVAVKVLRPNIRRQAERDATILLAGAHVLALSPKARMSDPVGHLKHFVNAIIDQTDLRIEAKNYVEFRKNFADNPNVHFPEVIDELSAEHVLAMEFIRGTKIDELIANDRAKLDNLDTTVREAIFQMCFKDGFLHADLHPGNMLVDDDGALVIFDVGLAKHLSGDVFDQFIDMTKCLTMGTPDDVVAHFRRYHTYLDNVDWDSLRVEVQAFADKFRAQDISELEHTDLLNDMFALGRRHHVHPVTDLTLVFVALITAQGIGKMLNPDANVFKMLSVYLLPILMARGDSIPATDEAQEAKAALGSA